MCTIDKMLIKGIRSFSPDNMNVIEFYKPLTLIVGQNGAGKTTIIECLKQACTGELPPNTRNGQSFIHDPKIAGETEVKAQIKLRFVTSTGQPVVVARSYQLTQKKATLNFKTLECVVQTINKDTGEKQAVTYRCVDVDRIVPSLMGVSKAILENVIFVHQEESAWPLADAQVLKKKFDDIFAATKYTKALEALRKLRSEKVQEVREMKLKLDHMKTHKDIASRLRADVNEAKSKMAEIKNQIGDLQEQIKVKTQNITEIDTKLRAMADVAEQLKAKSTQHTLLGRQAAEMFARLKEGDYEESTDQLKEWAENFDVQMATARSKIAAHGREISNKRMEAEALKDQYAKECKRQGRLSAEADAAAAAVTERDQFIISTSLSLHIPLPNGGQEVPLPPAAVEAFSAAIAAKRRAVEAELSELKASNRARDEKAGSMIDATTAALSRQMETARLKREALQQAEAQAVALRTQAASCSMTAADLSRLRSREQNAKAALEAKQAEEGRSGVAAGLEAARAALEELGRKIATLRQERDKVAAAGEGATRLRLKRADLAQREEALDALINARRGRLAALLGCPLSELPPPSGLKDALERVVTERKRNLVARQAEVRQLRDKEQITKGQLSAARATLGAREAEAASAREELRRGMAQVLGRSGAEEDKEFQEALTKAEQDAEVRSSRMSLAKSMIKVLGNFRSLAHEGDSCPLCRRTFAGAEKEACIEQIDAELMELPTQLQRKEAELAHLKNVVAGLSRLRPMHLRFTDLVTRELPPLRTRVAELEGEMQTLEAQVDELDSLTAVIDVEASEATRLLQEIGWTVERSLKEISELKAAVRSLEISMSAADAPRTVADVDAELEEVEGARAAHQAKQGELMRRQALIREEVMGALNAYHMCREELNNAMARAARGADLEDQARAADMQAAELAQQVTAAVDAQAPLIAKRDEAQKKREEARRKAAADEASAEVALREVTQVCDQLAQRSAPCHEYEARGGAAELERVHSALEDLKRRLEANAQALSQREEELKGEERKLSEHDTVRREIEDVLDWRRVKGEEDACAEQMRRLEDQLAQVGDRGALNTAASELRNARETLTRRADVLSGAAGQASATAERASAELRAEQYTDIDTRFRRSQIQLKTNEMALGDLEKYHKALEKALLSFHTTKMEDINGLVKELWQKTYRGQDIDYIQIKADADSSRSYAYRVVMISNGAELEMRGRCSAGQKVLACLIIRLALAETFCLNCGILALDEPSTNLDADNASSLAEALRSLITARREQDHFQLIVITHDERFAHLIGTREVADHLWRVTKDEAQHTRIEQEEIGD